LEDHLLLNERCDLKGPLAVMIVYIPDNMWKIMMPELQEIVLVCLSTLFLTQWHKCCGIWSVHIYG
jgi:hypothetical protein